MNSILYLSPFIFLKPHGSTQKKFQISHPFVVAQIERSILLAMIHSRKRVLGGGQERTRFGDTVYLRLCPPLLVDLSVVAALHLRKCCSDLYQNRELRMGMMRKKLRHAFHKGLSREPNLGEWTKWKKDWRD